MNFLRKLLSGTLQLVVMSMLLLGSCLGPGVLYVQSPKWSLEPYDAARPRMFFVAYMGKDDKGRDGLRATLLRSDPAKSGYTDIRYRLPEGEHREYRGDDDFDPAANITVANEPDGSQLVKVYMRGDTPWASYSEYRVKDNKIEPLRYGHSNAWWLLGILVCLVGVHYLMKPITRKIDRTVGLEQKVVSRPPA